MPEITDEQIQKWRERWDRHPGLNTRIADVLRGDKPAETGEEAARRMWAVNDLLREANERVGQDDFEVYEGEGEEIIIEGIVKIPKLDLKGIYWSEVYLKDAVIPYVHLEGAILNESHLEGTELSSSHLEGANFLLAHLEGTNIRCANLKRAFLYGAYLEGCDLSHAILEGADLGESHVGIFH